MLVETFWLYIEMTYFQKAYATLLNCWKFLRAYLYQVIWSNSDDGLRQEREVRLELNKMLQWITSSQVLIWSGCRSQTKIAVGNSFENYLRYSRADYHIWKLIRLVNFTKDKCRFIHRSVGEPAEGSLTRIHVSTNCALVFNSPCSVHELKRI